MGDIYCVGAGLSAADHLTCEATKVLGRCVYVFCAPDLLPLQNAIGSPREASRWISVAPFFKYGQSRHQIHKNIAMHIGNHASVDAEVAWVTRGHPGLVCGVTDRLRELGGSYQLHIVSGLSAVDYCLSLCPEVFVKGTFAVVNARDLASGRVTLSGEMPLIILQSPRAATDLYPGPVRARPEAYSATVKHLSAIYPADHGIILVDVDDTRPRWMWRQKTCAHALLQALRSVSDNVSIIVPAIVGATQQSDFDEQRTSLEHLAELYETPLERLLATIK